MPTPSSAPRRRGGRPGRRALGLLTAAALVAGVGPLLPVAPAGAATAAVASPLPFDLPAPTALRSSPKKVFAHYLASLPVSLDNQTTATDYYARNYLNPDGEGGKHAAYGGFVRDRPSGRPVIGTTDWRLQDMKSEVRTAAAAGIDGFSFDVLQVQGGSNPQLWDNALLMMRAAAETDPGFKIMLMPDMAGSLGTKDVATLAKGMATLAGYSSAYRLADGRLVVSPFKAEAHDAAWWKSFLDTMQVTYGIPVALLPVFVGNEQTYASSFAPISYGMSNWGSRNPDFNDPVRISTGSARDRAAKVKALGMKWMQPVSVQDARPNQAIFDEAENTTNFRYTWELARATGAEFVQIPTWNDYTETTDIAPSPKQGSSFLDINAYYLTWYKTGAAPAVTRDTVYLTHRTQAAAALPTYPETQLMRWRSGSPVRDTVEALTFMTAPGNVTITVGGASYVCAVTAGVDTCTVPLGTGKVSATTSRGGIPTAAVTTPLPVVAQPYVQDLQYIAASSGRTPSTPVPVVPGTETLVPRVVSAPAVADSYGNAGAPSSNYGSSSSLSVRGSVAATSYLRFAVPATPAGSTLTGASLRLRTASDAAAGSVDATTVSLVGAGWDERLLTWNNRPALGTAVSRINGATTPNTTYDAPLAPSVVAALAGGSTLALSSGGTDETRFWSEDFEGITYRPQLVLTYTPDPIDLPPTAPTGLTASATGPDVDLTWTAGTDDHGITGYELWRTDAAGFPDTSPTSVETVSGTAARVTAPVGTWYYRLVALDAAGGRSPASAEVAVTVRDFTAPSVPAQVVASGTSALTLSWAAATDDTAVTGYQVHRTESFDDALGAATLVTTTTGLSVDLTPPTGTSFYRVVAVDGVGNASAGSAPVGVTVADLHTPPPPAPVVLTAVEDTYGNEGAPGTTFGTSSSMSSRGSIGAVSYLRFAVPAPPAGTRLTSASLQVRTTSETGAGSADPHAVTLQQAPWSEATLTWRDRPTTTGVQLGALSAPEIGTVYTTPLDVAALQGLTDVGLQVTSAGTDLLRFWSSEHANASYRPQLVLGYSPV